MNFGALQAILLLIVWFHQSTSTKIEEVTTKWTFRNRKNSNKMSLPDYIQINLKLESGKETLNLIQQSMESIKLPLVVTQLEGQRSVWKPSEDQSLGIYKDPSVGVSATVAIKKVNGFQEALYMMMFTHGNQSFSLEPVFDDNPSLDKLEVEGHNIHNNRKILINIDGRLHSIVEIPATKSPQKDQLEREHLRGMIRDMRIGKRSVPIEAKKRLMTIEIFTLIDYSIFEGFLKRSKAESGIEKKEDVMKNILYIFTHVMEGVKNVYEGIEIEGLKFTTHWVGTLVAQSPADVPFIENREVRIDYNTVDAGMVLDNLEEWEGKNKAKGYDELELPNFDCLVTLTNYNLKYGYKDIHGIANNYKICTKPGMSLVKYNNLFPVINTISHELGHNMGLPHDNEDGNCRYDTNFVMARGPYASPNFYRFSNCSISYLQKTIDDLDSSNANCFTDGEDFIRNRERDIFLRLYPGQLYDLHEQCRMAYGPRYVYAGGAKNDLHMCWRISCCYGGNCETGFMLRAMDGTSCSDGSWCLNGDCVPDIRAPRAPKQCVNGDSLDIVYHENCRLIHHGSSKCNNLKVHCCASCSYNHSLSAGKGCQDTSDECHTLKPRDCYNNYYAKVCCMTCKSFEEHPDEDSPCRYGDRGDGCLDLVPEVCHLPTNYCCQTCATYSKSTNTTDFLDISSASSATTNPSTVISTKTYTSKNASSSDSGNGPNNDFAYPTTPQVSSTPTLPSTINPSTASSAANVYDTANASLINSENGPNTYIYTNFTSPTTKLATYTTTLPLTFSPTATSTSTATNIFGHPTALLTSSCTQGDFNGTLEYITVWGKKVYLNCSHLAEHDSSLCHDDDVQKYCCATCSTVKVNNEYCIDGDSKKLLVYRSKNFTCTQLVKYNPRLCEVKSTKDKCCKSCARFTIRPLDRNI